MNLKRWVVLCAVAAVLSSSFSATAQTTDPVAENMLVYQRSYGGWPKALGGEKVVYEKPLSQDRKDEIRATANDDDATIDNKATSREIVYLVKAFAQTKNSAYLEAAKRGLDYIFKAQYDNGGWPQYYPDKKFYRAEVTFNDDAIINIMNILYDLAHQSGEYAALGDDYAKRAKLALDKGVSCILKTQYKWNGKLTAWAAQYDQHDLTPAKARAFELPSLASSESANILKFLMRLENPTPEIKTAISSANEWFEEVKITGFRADKIAAPSQPKGKDVVLVADPSSVIWARFYDLKNMKPMFCGRDGIPKTRLEDIENERRAGYAWYGTWGDKLTREYPKWQKANGLN